MGKMLNGSAKAAFAAAKRLPLLPLLRQINCF